MKKGVILLLLLGSVPAFAAQWTQQEVNEYNACVPIFRELKWIKSARDQNMDTGGSKNLAEVEKDWQDKAQHLGCYAYQAEFERRNP